MAWFKKKKTSPEAVPSSSEQPVSPQQLLVDRAVAAPEARQFAVASDLVNCFRPFGQLDKAIVSPRQFSDLAGDALKALRERDAPLASATDAKVRRLLDLDNEEAEEPDGPGFFTHSTLVLITYALGLLTGEWQPATRNLCSRFLDTLGFLDDDLGTSVYEDGLAALDAALAGGAFDPALEAACRNAARQLRSSQG